ncbi:MULTISPECIES: hypothetical protein [Metallosphaera]|uniref:hypothetical protein n=1 Tax=Metallosphaera TaxID=41980 RepID=UPI001F066A4B|nr:hypothetical protein [Metallosphaera sedula]MCH1771933.1 hypothetical protein [Metallosphaera sedula]MCP6728545.1 hypothetical protein [Metallosphaera sedula]
MVSPVVGAYIFYVVGMTVILSISFERAYHSGGLYFWILVLSSISTATFLVIFSLSLVSVAISIILVVIPVSLYNVGMRSQVTSVVALLTSELLMSLLYYVLLRGLGNAIVTLKVYGTDIPSISFTPVDVIYAVIELANSFMFFLMIFPEIIYFSIKNKDYFPLIVSSLALGGPNIASEMTHSILPLPYDPIREASVFIALLSLSLSIYISRGFIIGKVTESRYMIFLASNFILSLAEIFYSTALNEIPYGMATLVTLFMSFQNPRINISNRKLVVLSCVPQYLWGMAIAYWFNLTNLAYLMGTAMFLIYTGVVFADMSWKKMRRPGN